MKTLVIGGTGMIGLHAARHLSAQGFDVSVAARRAPARSEFPVMIGSYADGSLGRDQLAGFDAILFAAGNDIRHSRDVADEAAFWREMQSEGVPRFAASARDAGVVRFVQIGSYYHHVLPDLARTNAYVGARKLADERTRALTTADFAAITLNPPSVVGAIEGASLDRYATLINWGRGNRPEFPDTAPRGGTNYVSVHSLCQAIEAAFRRGDPGRAYLVGDENLSFVQFFQKIVDAVGGGRTIHASDAEHRLLPDAFNVPGRGYTLSYSIDGAETGKLSYHRNDIDRTLREIAALVDAQ